MSGIITIRTLRQLGPKEIQGLSDVLRDCVEGGASVSFMWPLSRAKADNYWRGLSADVASGRRVVIAAEDAGGELVGTASVVLDLPENQPHRAELSKMLVHRRVRRQGVGAKLLDAAERAAIQAGKSLLVLDTASGDAERVYERGGWRRSGRIPCYALMPDGAPCATTIYFKILQEFRAYAPADRTDCLALFDANCPVYFAANERSDYQRFLAGNPDGYTVCVAVGQVVGAFGLFNHQSGRASLNWILISPQLQASGIGSAMMNQVKQQARLSSVTLVEIAASHLSAPFFAKFGAAPLRETLDGWGPGMHRIDMELSLETCA